MSRTDWDFARSICELSTLGTAARLVALVAATHAADTGENWTLPPMPVLMAESGLIEEVVADAIVALALGGWLVVPGDGHRDEEDG